MSEDMDKVSERVPVKMWAYGSTENVYQQVD
jgi:hypothetical protein